MPWKLVAGCLAALAAYLWFANRPAPPPDLVFSPLTNDAGMTAWPAISADGQLAVYASDRDAGNLELYLQPIPRGTPLRLTRTAGDETEPAISPDSATIAFRSGASLFVMPARGGPPRLLAPGGHDPRFSPDGKSIAYWDLDASYIIDAAGGTPRRLFADRKIVRRPVWSPTGALLLAQTDTGYIAGAPGAAPYDAAITLRPTDNAHWTSAGLVLLARTGWVRNVWRVPLDARGRQSAAPVRLTRAPESTGDLAVSRDGRMLLTSGTQHFNIWDDGRRLLYDSERDGLQQILLRDLATGDERIVATGTAPRWMNATQFAFRRRTATGHDAYLLDLNTGESRLLAKDATPCGASPDARILLLAANGGIDALHLEDSARTPFLHGTSLSDASFSPDGKSVVATDGAKIYLAPSLTPLAEGTSPRWSPDARRIFYIHDSAVYATTLTGEQSLIWRSPSPRLSLAPVNPAAQTLTLAPGRLALLLAETTTNLWLADPH